MGNMQRIRTLLVALGWLISINLCHAFSLLIPLTTPATTWQVTAIGYQLPGDIGGPGGLGEEYRWNLQNITYAFDDSFLDYFGQEGVVAVEEALAIINNLGPVSQFSPDLSEFPTEVLKPNGTAAAMGILDLKTATLSLTLEILGLADAKRWIYTLRQRVVFQNPTSTNYLVIHRNFDPVTQIPSEFLNGDFYTYQIFDPIPPQNYADAIEFSGNTPDTSNLTSPVTSFLNSFSFSEAGVFATGLSRDDAGGLKYIYSATNKNVETLVAGITLATNTVGNIVSPWVPYLGISNIFTNIFGTTNVTSTNLLINTALRPGIETITFVRTDYDSLLGQTLVPITNIFTDVIVSNNAAVLQRVQRITSQPDLIFTAEDLGAVGAVPFLTARGVNFINNDPINGQRTIAGPGMLTGPARITFTTLLPAYVNSSEFDFLDGPNPQNKTLTWGFIGESPESIIVFPNTFSLQELEGMILGP